MADRYWVGGTGTWNTTSTTNWSASSGGAGGASVPTAADNVIFDQAAAYTVTMTGALVCLNFTVSAGTVVFAQGTTPTLTISGNISLAAGTTTWNSNGAVTFNATTSRTVDTNNQIISGPITFNGVGGTWTLLSNFTSNAGISSSGALGTTTLTNGTLALGSYTLTTAIFNSSNSNTRTINFGTGKIVISSASTVAETSWTTATVTGLTVSGTPLVEMNNVGGATYTVNTGALSEANAISFSFVSTGGASIYQFTAGNVVKNLAVTGNCTLNNIAITVYGNFTHTSGSFGAGANAVTFGGTGGSYNISNLVGTTYDFPWTFNGVGGTWVLQNNLIIGVTSRVVTLTNGTLDVNNKTVTGVYTITVLTGTFTLNNTGGTTFSTTVAITHTSGTLNLGTNFTTTAATGYTLTAGTLSLNTFTLTTPIFSSSNANARTISFGTGKIVLNNTTGSIWNTGTVTNFSVSGTPLVESIGASGVSVKTINTGTMTEAQSISFSLLETTGFTSLSYTFTASNAVRNLTITTPNTGLTTTFPNIALSIYGSFTHTAGAGTISMTAGTNAWTFAATSGSYTITNIAGFTYDFPWTFGSATSTATWTLANNLTLGATRQLTLTNGVTDFNSRTLSAAGITILTGTPTIVNTGNASFTTTLPITHTSGTLNLGVNFTTTSATGYTLTAGTLSLGTYTLTTPVFTSSGTGVRTLAFGTGQLALSGNAATIFNVTTATNFSTTGTVYINSTYTGATGTRTFAAGFTEAQAAGYDVKTSGTNGIVIGTSATDTVAFTGNFNNFDLTGFTNTLSNTARTIYGNFTVPNSGGTLTAGTTAITFGGSGTQLITTNSRTLNFPFTFNGTGTFKFVDSLTLTAAVTTNIFTLTAGNLDLNNNTISGYAFSSTNSNIRSILFGTTGQITLTGNSATVWDTTTGTNFTWTGTPKLFASNPGSAGTRIFAFGTIAEAYTFNVKFAGTAQSNAFTIATSTDILTISGNINDFDLTNSTNVIGAVARNVFGNLTIPSGASPTINSTATATSLTKTTGTSIITTNGRSVPFALTFNGSGTFQLNGALTTTQAIILTTGTLDLNNVTLTALRLSSSGTGVRSILFGTTGQITLTDGNTVTNIIDFTDGTNFTWTGTHRIFATYNAGSAGTRTFAFGTIAEAYTFNVKFAGTSQANAFTINTSTDQVAITGNINDFDFTGSTNTLTATERFVYGNYVIPATGGVISSSTIQGVTFVGSSGTRTITTNGRTVPVVFTFNGAGRTFQFNGALTTTSKLDLLAGTLDLNNLTITALTFSSSGTGVRSILFGSTGQISLTAGATSATIVDISTGTNFSWTGTPKIVSTYAGATATTRTFTIGNTAAIDSTYAFDVIVGTGTGINLSATATDSVALTGIFNSVDLRGLSGTLTNTARSIAGSFRTSLTGGTYTAGTTATTFIGNTSTYIIDTATRALDFPFTFNGSATWTIANTFTTGSSATVSTRALTLTTGNVSFNGVQINCGQFSSSGTNARNLDFGANGRILLLNSGTTIWDTTTGTNFTWTGNFDVDSNYTGAVGTRTINFGTISEQYAPNVKVATAGSDFGLNTGTDSVALSGNIGNLDLTNFAGTLTNLARNVYGNLTFPASGGTFTPGTAVTTLASTSGTELITYNGRTISFPLTINGTGGTFVANGNILMSTANTLTLTNGHFNANLANITASTITISTGNAAVSNLSTTLTVTHTSGNLNLNSNVSTGDYTFTAGNLNLNNYIITTRTFSSSGTGVRTINFSNTGKVQLLANTAVTYWNSATPTNFTYTGTSNIETIGGGVVTKTINTGAMTEAQALNWNLKDTAGNIAFTSSNVVENLNLLGGGANTFTLTNVPITIYGDYTYGTGNTSTYASNYFNGVSDYLSITSSSGGTLDLTSVGTFTIETWIYPMAVSSDSSIISNRTPSGSFGFSYRMNADRTIQFYYTGGSSITTTGTVSLNAWTHIAAVRSGANFYLFINGTLDTSSSTFSDGTNTSQAIWIGTNASGGGYFAGYISNLRVLNGTALYTSTFTAPSSPLTAISNTSLLTCKTGDFADLSTNKFTITRNGTPYLNAFNPFNSAISPYLSTGTNAWTFATTGTQSITSNEVRHDFPITFAGTGTYNLQNGLYVGNTRTTTLTTGTLNLNDYILNTGLFSSSGTGVRSIGFANTGKIQLAAATAVTYWNTGTPTNFTYTGTSNIETVGSGDVTRTINTGAMTETQSLNFTLNDTAGTTSFTAGNTVKNLILNGQFVLNNIATTIYGNYTYGTSYTNGYASGYFNGTTDYLSVPFGSAFTYNGDFTIEGWFNASSLPTTGSQKWLIGSWNAGSNLRSFYVILINTAGVINLSLGLSPDGTSASAVSTLSNALTLNTRQWYHFAVTRSGSTVTYYLNGVAVGSGTNAVSGFSGGSAVSIGVDAPGLTAAFYWNGYISNLRVVKGVAVYTGNFTVPTTPLASTQSSGTNISAITGTQTSLLTCQSNTFVDNSTNNFTVTTNGTAIVTYGNPFNTALYGPALIPGTNAWTFANTSTQTINTNSLTHDFPFTFSGTGTYTLQNNLTTGTARTTTLTSGTLNLNDYTLNTGLFSSSNSNNREIDFANTGKIQLTASTAVTYWNTGTITGFSYTGNSNIETLGSGAVTKTINTGNAVESQALNFNIKDTAGTVAFTSANRVKNLTLNGSFTLSNIPITIFGDYTYTSATALTAGTNAWTFDGSAISYINGGGVTHDFPWTIIKDTDLILQSATTIGSTRTTSYKKGTFDLNGYNYTTGLFDIGYSGESGLPNSTLFGGSPQYLTVSGIPIQSSGEFTFETWVNILNENADGGWIYTQRTGASAERFGIFVRTTVSPMEIVVGYSGNNYASTGSLNFNTWYHYAVTRDSSNTLRVFVNGVLVATESNFTGTIQQTNATIGRWPDLQSQYINGYLNNLRVVRRALYTSNFTPLTLPLTKVANTSLLTCQSSSFIDSSVNQFSITPIGGITTSNVTPLLYNSVYFDGTGDYLSVPAGPFVFGTNSFTVEAWVYTTAYNTSGLGGEVVIDNWAGGAPSYVTNQWQFWITSAGLLQFSYATSASSYVSIGTGTVPLNTWTHIAVVRNSTTVTVYINGVASGSGTVSQSLGVSAVGSIARQTNGGAYTYTGYISDARIVNGTAVYTANFAPSTSPLTAIAGTSLLTCQNTYFKDNSNNDFTITPNGQVSTQTLTPYLQSVSFDGVGDYLEIANDTALQMGTGDFTIEAFVYPTVSQTTNAGIIGKGTATTGYTINMTGTTVFENQTNLTSADGAVPVNQWTHIAFVRQGSTAYLYVNGILVDSKTNTINYNQTNIQRIGTNRVASVDFKGYISNVRIIKGTAVYTSNFTPSQIPLTVVANTSLLTCQTPFFTDYSNNSFTITTVGNASTNNYTPFVPEINLIDKTLQFSNGGTITITGSGSSTFNNQVANNIIFESSNGNATISMTSSSSKMFSGNNATYTPIILNQGGTGTLFITGNNTFEDITATITSASNTTISLPVNSTTTVNTFSLSGNNISFRYPTLNSNTPGTIANVAGIANVNGIYDTNADYIRCEDIAFTPYAVDGTDYIRWFVGANSLSLNNNYGALFQNYDANNFNKVYLIETGNSWTIPSDFNISNNTVHLFGGGGGGSAALTNGANPRGGPGGGGGGYTKVINYYGYENQQLTLSIGSGGLRGSTSGQTGSAGGNTSITGWYGSYFAYGGRGGGAPAGAGGAGGIGATFNGGAGGNGGPQTGGAAPTTSGGGGGGAGGPLGVGGAGGTGIASTAATSGGGGGGNGGGSAGGAGLVGGGNAGGNNALGFGRGTSTTDAFSGGGAAGGYVLGKTGGDGIDVLNSFGGGGGGSGGGSTASNRSPGGTGGRYGGGGGGGAGDAYAPGFAAGANGSGGVIIISYTPNTAPRSTSAFFSLF